MRTKDFAFYWNTAAELNDRVADNLRRAQEAYDDGDLEEVESHLFTAIARSGEASAALARAYGWATKDLA